MHTEIERKFLVHKDLWFKEKQNNNYKAQKIVQAYIQKNDKCVIRVRITDDDAFITLKSRRQNFSCTEFEYQIPYVDAKFMLENFTQGIVIEKNRFKVNFHNQLWEVDEFLGDNVGLIVAEIELDDENEIFAKPIWLSEEVSKISKYFNAVLSEEPFSLW